jgi:putative addiction module killer protein
MIEIRKTATYANWLDGLRDINARARIQVRIEPLATGNAGDVKPVGKGVSELRINFGPGWRRQEYSSIGHQNRSKSRSKSLGQPYDKNLNQPL